MTTVENLKDLLNDYELIIINLSEDKDLESNLEKYDNLKYFLTEEFLKKHYTNKKIDIFLKLLCNFFNFDINSALDIIKYI